MKTYVSILLVVLGLAVVVIGGYVYTKKNDLKHQVVQDLVKMKTYSSKVSRFYEGDNNIEYSFNIPEYATTTTELDGAFTKITTGTSSYATVYVSYEGGRGFTPLGYIDEIIAPHVSVINPLDEEIIGNYKWQVAESEGSEWHIAQVSNDQWLFIVENKKVNHDLIQKTLESVKVK